MPYIFSATIYGLALTLIFALWYLSEKSLSVHSIYTRRRELFTGLPSLPPLRWGQPQVT